MSDNSSGNLTDELSGLDFAAVSPEEFARIVKGLSAKQLGAATALLGECLDTIGAQAA